MSAFGPFYPPRLQASLNHAERMARLLLEEELRMTDAPRSAAWLVGRAGEIERFAEGVIDTWQRGRRARQAAAATDGYLAALHAVLAQRLGITGPSCCGGDAVTTQVPARGGGRLVESIDRLLMNLEARRESPGFPLGFPPSPR